MSESNLELDLEPCRRQYPRDVVLEKETAMHSGNSEHLVLQVDVVNRLPPSSMIGA